MDWNKLLNGFLIIFIILNIGLFTLNQINEGKKYTLSEERISLMNKKMKDKEVSLYTFIFDYKPKARLELKLKNYDREKIKKIIFEDRDYAYNMTYNGIIAEAYQGADSTLVFYEGDNKGLVYYKGNQDRYKPGNLKIEAFERVAKTFAKDVFGNDIKMEISHRQSSPDGYSFELNQKYGKDLIFSSYLRIIITEDGIKEAIGVAYDPIDYFDEKREIYAFDEVLYSLINYLEEKEIDNRIIKGADLGFYILDDKTRELTAEAIPMYRFILENGDRYYINAYSNEIFEE